VLRTDVHAACHALPWHFLLLYLHRLRQEQMTAARAPGGSWQGSPRCTCIAYVQAGERQVFVVVVLARGGCCGVFGRNVMTGCGRPLSGKG